MDITHEIKAIAREQGISATQVRADMIVAIHRAYLVGTPAFRVIFGDREPTVEEFIGTIAHEVTGTRRMQ